jgi:hypothetical protein
MSMLPEKALPLFAASKALHPRPGVRAQHSRLALAWHVFKPSDRV